MQGLVIENITNTYKVEVNNKIFNCVARGKFKKEDISPVVGDIVDIDESQLVIDKVFERKTYIKRPKIANITQIIFVISMKNPKPDLLLLDKQLAFAEFLNIKPLIIINKIDLDNNNFCEEIERIYTSIGYKVIKTNAKSGLGIDELKEKLKNNINAFSGNSGVGKSTLINKIFNNNLTTEGEISLKNKKGKNTTTNICLYKIDSDTYIADTPGFSTFDISEIKSEELQNYFIDIHKNVENCEFSYGCTHIKESNCGVKKALDNEELFETRYNNYVKIYKDLKDREEHKW